MDLPEIYHLDLSESQLEDGCREELFNVKSTGDPCGIVSPYDLQLRRIADKTRFSEIILYFRAVQIMENLADPESWSKTNEERLSQRINSAGIYFHHYSMRIMIARRAVNYILTELIDAEELFEEDIEYIEREFRSYDPRMLTIKPASRPPCISPIEGIEKHASIPVDWADNLKQAFDSVSAETTDSQIILAEHTTLKRLDWGIPSEEREAYVCPVSDDDDRAVIHVYWNRFIDEYPLPIYLDPTQPLIWAQKVYHFDTPGAGWLAINPSIAHDLGWKFTNEGLFRWIDNDGKIMVESIWWKDGMMDHSPPLLDDEVGEGWLVVATPDAFDQIKERFQYLQKLIIIEREFYQDREKRWKKGSKKVDVK